MSALEKHMVEPQIEESNSKTPEENEPPHPNLNEKEKGKQKLYH